MDNKNTIVIKSDPYRKEVKYFWKNDKGTLSDLAEANSPFSKAKMEYGELSNAVLADIAERVVRIIDEVYNRSGGVYIEIEGVEADYAAVQKVIENKFSDKHIDCKWNKRKETVSEKISEKTLADLEKIFLELARALVQYDQKGVIELGKENDRRGWLQQGFAWRHVTDESVRDAMRELARGYLDTIIKEIRSEKENSVRMIEKLEQEWKQERERAAEIEKIVADKKLKELVSKVCKNEKRAFGKQFEDMLDQFGKQKLPDEEGIADRIKGAEQYAFNHREEWEKNIKGILKINSRNKKENNTSQQLIEGIARTEYVKKRLIKVLNGELEQYTAELNEKTKAFADKQAEELKRKILEEVYNSGNFTESQKEVIRQYIMGYRNVSLSYCVLKAGEIMEEKEFRWMKKNENSFLDEKDKKAICREYKKKLKDEFEDKNKAILKDNDKIFNKWDDEILKGLKADAEDGQMQKKLNEYSERRDRFIRLEEKFVAGRNKIKDMIFI